MLFYTYIVWRLKNENIDLRYILWKEKFKLLSKWFEELTNNGYSCGIEPLTLTNLEDFYLSIYQKEIEKKNNANVFNLIDKFKDRIHTDEDIQFAFIKKGNILLAWGIFTRKIEKNNNVCILWFRSYEKIKIQWLFLGYYIEYMFYKRALENNVEFISRGRDRNCYGAMWSNIGLPIHKLQYKFLPYCLWKENPEISIDESSLDTETLIFVEPNTEHLYTKAILYTDKTPEEIKKEYAVIEKRWIQLEIRNVAH